MATTADEVWQLLGELIQSQKESDRRFQETEQFLKKQTKETEHLLKEQSQKTDQRYQNLKILGAVAAMVTPKEVASYAYRQGLFVIAQSGDNLIILNDQKFKPKAY